MGFTSLERTIAEARPLLRQALIDYGIEIQPDGTYARAGAAPIVQADAPTAHAQGLYNGHII
jgi:hypothetical protein